MLKPCTRDQMLAHAATLRAHIDRQERTVARLAELGDAKAAERAAYVLMEMHINHAMQLEVVGLLPEGGDVRLAQRITVSEHPGFPLPH